MQTTTHFDVVIIGGSYAGLGAALVLGRSLRRVLVIDSGKPCNRQTPHSHGFLTRDGQSPSEIATIAREQISQYSTVQFLADTVLLAERLSYGFRVTTDEGQAFRARKLVLAFGIVDQMPELPGFAECCGRSVLHCPYCHGYEVRQQPTGILASGELGYEMATLIQHWTHSLTLFTNGPSMLTESQRQLLDALAIPVIETPVAAIDHQQGYLTALQLTDGTQVPLTAVYARVPFQLSADLARHLGCVLSEPGLIQITEFGETTVPGVFAAGDATSPMRQLIMAAANGSKTGAWINRKLIAEDLPKLIPAIAVEH